MRGLYFFQLTQQAYIWLLLKYCHETLSCLSIFTSIDPKGYVRLVFLSQAFKEENN